MPYRLCVILAAVCSVLVLNDLGGRILAQESRTASSGERRAASVRPQSRRVPQAQWEYKTGFHCTFAGAMESSLGALGTDLNEYGKDGWELVGFAPAATREDDRRQCYVAAFKRAMLF